MALFKEIKCVHCGKKAGMMNRTKLSGDEYVCGNCISGIPPEFVSKLSEYTSQDFKALRDFFDQENKLREKQFREKRKYKCIHLDTEHNLFYLDTIRPKVYFRLEDAEQFDLEYRPETVKEGFLSDKVTGHVHMTLRVKFPPFSREEIIARDEKSSGEIKGLIKKRLSWQNPKGMDEVQDYIDSVLAKVRDKELEEYLRKKFHSSDAE